MFDNLTDKLDLVFKKLKGHGKLTEKNIEEGLKEVRIALLEADVHYKVVKKLIADIKERALGQEVMASLTPGQQAVKIVNDELTEIMGTRHEELNLSGSKPASIMLVGLQGAGKTTTAGKLAVFLRKKGKKPYLVPADVYRPAAIDQLKKLGEQLSIPVYSSTVEMDPVQICSKARITAQQEGCDILLLDTAGRLHIDENLMAELCNIKDAVNPSDILLIADAMTGQDAVNIAKSFDNTLNLNGNKGDEAMKDLIKHIAQALVDHPEQVSVSEVEGNQTSVLELQVAKDDLGKVIGKQGRTARAMRTILSAASAKIKKRTVLEIIE